jgi:hypothetical protein
VERTMRVCQKGKGRSSRQRYLRRLGRFWVQGSRDRARDPRSPSPPSGWTREIKTHPRVESNRISGGAAGLASSGKEETAGLRISAAWVWTLDSGGRRGGEEKGGHEHGVYSEG